MTALPAKQRPATIAIRGRRPRGGPRGRRRGSRAPKRRRGPYPRAALPPLGEEHRRQLHALDQLEQAVLLLVAHRSLGAGEDRVVVGEDRAGGAVAELLRVDGADPRDQAVGGRALEQLAELAARPLGCDREPAVLDEAARVDQVGEVLARRSRAGGVAPLNRLGAGGVLGQRRGARALAQVRAPSDPRSVDFRRLPRAKRRRPGSVRAAETAARPRLARFPPEPGSPTRAWRARSRLLDPWMTAPADRLEVRERVPPSVPPRHSVVGDKVFVGPAVGAASPAADRRREQLPRELSINSSRRHLPDFSKRGRRRAFAQRPTARASWLLFNFERPSTPRRLASA